MTRVLVTGAASFTARHLLPVLAADHEVDTVVATDIAAAGPAGVRYLRADLTAPRAARAVVEEAAPDVVFHLAGMSGVDADACYAVNLGATRRLLDACAAVLARPIVCVVSSAAVYGFTRPDESPVREVTPLRPVTAYGASKAAAELYALALHRQGTLRAVVVRPFNLLGPGLPPGLAASDFLAQCVAERSEIRVGTLETVRDFVDVRDAVSAYAAVVRVPEALGRVFNVASGRGVSVGVLLDAIVAAAGGAPRVVRDPARVRAVEVSEQVGDPSALARATGWSPVIPLATSIADMVAEARAAASR